MSSWSGCYMLDPAELEARFGDDENLSYLDNIFSEPSEEDNAQIDQIKEVLENLPPREADFVDLYYFRKLKQTDIAFIFGVSQPTVCYRLARAADRIRFLLNLPKVEKSQMTDDLRGFFADPLDVQIMVFMWETTCQSEVAKRLNVTQGLVRHRFIRSLEKLRSSPKHARYVAIFDYIASNLNILREVQRNLWNDSLIRCVN